MSVYIPITGIIYFVWLYLSIGVALYMPLMHWTNRFITGNHRAFDGADLRNVWNGILRSAAFWPIIVAYSAYTEITYRKKGYL